MCLQQESTCPGENHLDRQTCLPLLDTLARFFATSDNIDGLSLNLLSWFSTGKQEQWKLDEA